jgi:hypothetical protein
MSHTQRSAWNPPFSPENKNPYESALPQEVDRLLLKRFEKQGATAFRR